MKKLFFFRSFGGNNQASPPSKDKQIYWEKPSDCVDKSRSKKQVSDDQTYGAAPCLRRSLSFSSGGMYDGQFGQRNLNDQKGSPGSCSNPLLKQSVHHSSRRRTLTPERQCRTKSSEATAARNVQRAEKASFITSSRAYSDSSESSSYSSNVSSKVLDLYIDGEYEVGKSALKSSFPVRSTENVNGGKRPPRAQCEEPVSPSDGWKQKPNSQSFRELQGSQLHFSSKDWAENGFGHESPRKIAKSVVERLSQSRFSSKISSKECDPDIPITIEDIYNEQLSRCSSVYSEGVSQKSSLDEPIETIDDCHREETIGFSGRNDFYVDHYGVLNKVETVEDTEFNISRKLKDAEERVIAFSEELEQEKFFRERGLSVPALIQTVRNLAKDKVNLATQVSAILQEWISDRASTAEDLKLTMTEVDGQIRRLEKEKYELQSALEKELDRRSSEWTLKLEKYQAEEHRLRERVRELAEQNVSLQREVSSFSEREMDARNRITCSEQQLKDLTTRVDESREENKDLQQNLFELQEKYRATKEDRDCIQRNHEEKVKECKDLHRSITRLQRICSDQDKSIDGLRGLCEEVGKKMSVDNLDNQFGRLQMEQMRLTGVEQALRREVESYRLEVISLRHENTNLLQRLKGSGNEGGSSIIKLDCELWNRLHFLQNEGLSLLVDSTQLCGKLFEQMKRSACHSVKDGPYTEYIGLEGQFIVECEVKLQSCKRGTENLTRSLQTLSTVLQEKSSMLNESWSCQSMDGGCEINNQKPEINIDSELKAETLLTNLLREKLYSKELDMEQLQAELAAAIRGTDILKSEVQNALDSLSCVTHKMKDLELQTIKKDENINQLQNNLQECTKELTIVRGILPKVSEERDMMWKEVKQYSEKNMLLNSEINVLKKKVEALDEDILVKEGQITILKDTLGRPFDLLASSDSTQEFLLE